MKIDPQTSLRELYFINKLCFITVIAAAIFVITSFVLSFNTVQRLYVQHSGPIYGPIVVGVKPQIYEVEVKFSGQNSSTQISGEVLDKNKDTLYEFEKEFWHESGYDSEGYWSESDSNANIHLTFAKAGTYYIKFDNYVNNKELAVYINKKKYSHIPHLNFAGIFLIISAIVWMSLNFGWLHQKISEIEFED